MTLENRMQKYEVPLSIKTNELLATDVRPKTDPDVDAAQAGLRIACFKAEEELRSRNLEHAAEIAKIQEEHGVIASRLHEEVRAARTAHELAQDQLRLLRQNKRKITSSSTQRKPSLLSAEEIPWLFCVSGAGGISYHTIHELSPDAQEEVRERFQYYLSASNDAQYGTAGAIHHNTYATMVSESNRLANVGKGCVQTIVVARGNVSRAPHQTGEYEACGLCQRKGCPCAKLIIHNGNPVLYWYGQGSVASSVTTWQDAAYWIR